MIFLIADYCRALQVQKEDSFTDFGNRVRESKFVLMKLLLVDKADMELRRGYRRVLWAKRQILELKVNKYLRKTFFMFCFATDFC